MNAFESSSITEEQREKIWQELLAGEKEDWLFCRVIAVKSNRSYNVPDDWRERAWQELVRRGVKCSWTLHYLRVNAPSPWNEKARKFEGNIRKKKK